MKKGWVGVLEAGNWVGEQGICYAELKDGFQEGSSKDRLPASLPSPLELTSPKGGREQGGASVRAQSGGWVWGEWTPNPKV